jgi:hypothetical protein
VERITPYLYTASNEPVTKAEGKCGQIAYYPQPSKQFKGTVSWNITQINPNTTLPLNDKGLEFKVYSNA